MSFSATTGSALHAKGETVSEMLDWVPARLRVIRICRPRYRLIGTDSCINNEIVEDAMKL
jgi:hypothetical protein